jgi:hypothetical protein
MERVNDPAFLANILLTLVQYIPMNQHQTPGLNLPHRILPTRPAGPKPLSQGKLPPFIHHKFRPGSFPLPHKPLLHLCRLMTPGKETQTTVLHRCVFQRIPETDSRGRVRVQERRVLVRGHGTTDLRLFTDDHALQTLRGAEAEGASDSPRGVGCRRGE